MSPKFSVLQKRMATQFPDVRQVDESIIRFTRKAGEQPFAVCYVDLTDKLPETLEKLLKYQDRIIGTHYFEGNKSLQWNNYLYFITSENRLRNKGVRRAKELIEADRSYARKFVISEADLDSVLNPPVVAPKDISTQANVLSIWTERLANAGLDNAILSDDPIPKRLKLIESSFRGSTVRTESPIRKQEADEALPFIQSLILNEFRNFPQQRSFQFRTVNLIYGANGSGKTSLLEAIELLYCGRNKRNPNVSPIYELVATFGDGSDETATNRRKLKAFRDRNLIWYGQPEIKTNNLFQSFARFNFLDTDAAVSITESANRIVDDLSKLLVGPEASKTWRNIIRVSEAVEGELRGLRPREKEAKEELTSLKQRIKEARGIKRESDLICARVEKMINKLKWSEIEGDKESSAELLVEEMSGLVALVKQAAALAWIKPPVSSKGLSKYCREAKLTIEKVEADIAQLGELLKDQIRLSNVVKGVREALELTEKAKLLVESGILAFALEQNKQKSTVANYSRLIAGFSEDFIKILPAKLLEADVGAAHKALVLSRSRAEAFLASAKTEYEKFSKLRDESLNLAQELRQIAIRILKDSPNPDECPLCHTQFGPGQLKKHINADVDEHLELLGQKLISGLRRQESALQEEVATENALRWLKDFKERAGLAIDISVRSALDEVDKIKRTIVEAQRQIETLKQRIITLESQGLSLSRLEEISDRLNELGYPLMKSTSEGVDRIITTLKIDLKKATKALVENRKTANELQRKITTVLGSGVLDITEINDEFSKLKERLATTQSIQEKLNEFLSLFPWPEEKPLSKLLVEAESIRNVAAELQMSLAKERQDELSLSASMERQKVLEKRVEDLKTRSQRLSDAHSTLDKLRKEHSLESAMDYALQQNRSSVETIFSHIHSPADFQGLGSSWTTLIRVLDGSEARLSEISSGQRAAFALSIFLAQNSQLKKAAPPVVLIDDPIAHVDDLNSLSFLDYLREVVLAGGRQIFFSTANSKLATLFERKFDFLGNVGFRRIDLCREEMP
jgi:DNA repair protein SbcC/Rad50